MCVRLTAEKTRERRAANAPIFRRGRPTGSRSPSIFRRRRDVTTHSLVDVWQGTRLCYFPVFKTLITVQLRNGQLVCVPPILIRRLKSHFVSLPCGVDLILGLNGYIWVSKHISQNRQPGEEGLDAESVYSNQNEVSFIRGRFTNPRAQHFSGDRFTDSNGRVSRHQPHQNPRQPFRSPFGRDPSRSLRVGSRERCGGQGPDTTGHLRSAYSYSRYERMRDMLHLSRPSESRPDVGSHRSRNIGIYPQKHILIDLSYTLLFIDLYRGKSPDTRRTFASIPSATLNLTENQGISGPDPSLPNAVLFRHHI